MTETIIQQLQDEKEQLEKENKELKETIKRQEIKISKLDAMFREV